MEQKYTSKETSLNQVAAVYKIYDFRNGSKILDYGGGKYDTATEYMRERGVMVTVYDPYNRSDEHNRAAREIVPDYVVCSNVLNVIAEDDVVRHILEDIATYNVPVIITVYEGDGTGIGKETKKGFQRNAKTQTYVPIVSEVFSDVQRKGKLIIAKKGERK